MTPVEVLQRLRTMLHLTISPGDQLKKAGTYRHGLGIAFTIIAIKQSQHILLKPFAILLNRIPRLNQPISVLSPYVKKKKDVPIPRLRVPQPL